MADFQAILKDKRVWAVAGIGGVAGLVVLMRGKGPGNVSGDAVPGYGVQTGGSVGSGSYDSTSADIAAQLGQYQTGLQTALGEYNSAQNDALSGYQQTLSDSLANLKTPAGASPQYATSWKAGTTYTLDSVARRFGVSTQAIIDANAGRNVKAGIAKGATINIPITSTNLTQFNKG